LVRALRGAIPFPFSPVPGMRFGVALEVGYFQVRVLAKNAARLFRRRGHGVRNDRLPSSRVPASEAWCSSRNATRRGS
jgi:hypothetical protein